MSTNIHQPPSRSDSVAFLRYQIAVMQAYASGQDVGCCMLGSAHWNHATTPTWSWHNYNYRIVPPKLATGHNPDNLTEDQVGIKDGWRLLTKEEIEPNLTTPMNNVEYHGVEGWRANGNLGWIGHLAHPFRTKQPVGFFLPKPKVKTLRDWLNELPDGYRELAIANLERATWAPLYPSIHGDCKSMQSAIMYAFPWTSAAPGQSFWANVREHYSFKENPPALPPLPKVKKLVPWTFDTCPMPGFLIRRKENTTAGPVTCMFTMKHLTGGTCGTWVDMSDMFEHSLDGGKTWNPCGVME